MVAPPARLHLGKLRSQRRRIGATVADLLAVRVRVCRRPIPRERTAVMTTTLAEELEQAAKIAESVARYPNGIWNAQACEAFARRLRLRAGRVREVMVPHVDVVGYCRCVGCQVAGPVEGE